MRALVALAVVLLLVAGAGAHPGDGAPDARPVEASAAGATNPTWAGTTIGVQVRPNGDARWNVTFRYSLPTDNDTAAFRRLAREFDDGEAGPDPALYRQFVERAAAETGRQMALQNVERSWRIGNDTGALSLQFTWTGFARTEGERVVLGDVFRTESGTWLPELDAGQTLVVHAPPEYAVESASTGHRNGSFRYEGPRTFRGGVLNATFVPQVILTPTQTPTTSTGTGGPPFEGVPATAAIGAAGVVVVLLVVLLFRGRPAPWGDGPAGAASSDGGPSAADGGADAAAGGEHDAAGDEAAAGEGADTDGPDPDDPFASVDEDLLSDEERVEVLLEANGGRMKQGDIVSETGWSNAKVSQLLSSMADEGRLDKLRIGRENLITLPDEDVGDLGNGE